VGFLAAAGKGGPKAEGGTYEQQYVTSVIELHDKYLQYVVNCFSNSSPFHKALKEAFESFCNKSVAGCTSAELMATFCNNLLKKVIHSPPPLPPPRRTCASSSGGASLRGWRSTFCAKL